MLLSVKRKQLIGEIKCRNQMIRFLKDPLKYLPLSVSQFPNKPDNQPATELNPVKTLKQPFLIINLPMQLNSHYN